MMSLSDDAIFTADVTVTADVPAQGCCGGLVLDVLSFLCAGFHARFG